MTFGGAERWAALRRAYEGRRVLVTGHTGFKGAWLTLWLERLGAQIVGVALPPEDEQGLFSQLHFRHLDHRLADIRDHSAVNAALRDVDADYVFHLAAQALVRPSYEQPVETFATNVMGTAHVLEAARRMRQLKAIVVVTSDKCYENREWAWRYRESDALGGADPYSASKGATEIVAASYRHSFFAGKVPLATARAGNVIGGGDWAQDRIMPDIARAALSGRPLSIRHPGAIRPWQHVMEPLAGYLLLGARLAHEGERFARAWNFGPTDASELNVLGLAKLALGMWGSAAPEVSLGSKAQVHEANILRLDVSAARAELDWRPCLTIEKAVGLTVEWYKAFGDVAPGAPILQRLCLQQLADYEAGS